MDDMIQIEQLQFRYSRFGFQLKIDQLHIARGDKVAFVGPSGSGKTTLLNLISDISLPLAGQLLVGGHDVAGLSDRERRDFRIGTIGAVFQQFELVEYLNVRENILLPYLINPSLKLDASVRSRAEELAAQVGMADKLTRHVKRLSQGEQQRVAICRAMLPSPRLILADEPTGNLDPANKRKILDLLFERCLADQLTLVAVTHDHNILDGFDRTVDFETFRSEVAA